MGFFKEGTTGYVTSAKNLLIARRYFRDNRYGEIQTGMWTDPTWTKKEFHDWFRSRLHEKINRKTVLTGRKTKKEYQDQLAGDAWKVREYTQKRIRYSRCRGLLSTPEMQKRYPHINCQHINCQHRDCQHMDY